MGNLHLNLFLLILISQCHESLSWGWYSSTTTKTQSDDNLWTMTTSHSNDFIAEFSMEPPSDGKGVKLVDKAKMKLESSNSCWQNAYKNLFASCSEIITDKDKKSRLAWSLSDCFQRDSGRPSFPSCDSKTPMVKCLKKLDESAHTVYLEFFLETNSICHQLQTDVFKHETERLVNDLSRSAQFAENKLETIEEKSEQLLQNSNHIHDSLTSIDLQTQQVAKASKDVEDKIHDVLKQSNAIFEQSRVIVNSQSELQEGQADMRAKLESNMAILHESYESLGQGIEMVKRGTLEIEKEISEVGNTMSLKMQTLQNRADDIGNVAGMSLDKQKQLLDGQSIALEGLDFLTKFQSQALEESRATLQKLAEFGHKQQEELLQRQEQLQRAHDHLIQNSQSILAAQEAFESRQAIMFTALDKLFTLHNTLLLESRFTKAFFFYSLTIFVLYMLTSAKQTSAVRARLYLGLCVTFMIDFGIARFGSNDFDQQNWIASKVFWGRSSFLLIAALQILQSIYTYRNYEVLNHQMLLTLYDKVNTMEMKMGKELYLSKDSDSSLASWIDVELPEDVNNYDDPDYNLPEEVAENSVTTSSITRKYNLRPRLRS